MHDDHTPATLSADALRSEARAVAAELRTAAAPAQAIEASGGGSKHRGLPETLRRRFIDVRTALHNRGLYDPLLIRFDSATVAQASNAEIAERLDAVAASI